MQVAQIDPFKVRGVVTPERIVIHAMAEYLDTEPYDQYAPDFLRNIGLSAHAFVTPSGVLLQAFAPGRGASAPLYYHAKGHNSVSIGIEFLVSGVHTYASFASATETPYVTDAQWSAGVDYTAHLLQVYNLTAADMVPHSALSPRRKIDPNTGFGWDRFVMHVEKTLTE